MASEASRSDDAAAADSYIGSLISLTTKFEIRYEGVLRHINTDESSIGLINVKSYGTEGRKRVGQEVPPNDRIYEYILFRGSDIKDLTVKAAAPVQNALPIPNDPAILQSQHFRLPPVSTSLPSAGSGIADTSSHAAQMAFPRSTFPGDLPLYQPGGTLGSWGFSTSPNADRGLTTDPSSSTAETPVHKENLQGGLPLYQPGGVLGSWGSSPFPNSDGSSHAAVPSSQTTQMAFPRATFQGDLPLYQPRGSLGAWGYSTSPNTNGRGLTTDPSSSTAQMPVPRGTLQGGLPLYHPGGVLGSWGSSPFPNTDGSGYAAVPSSQTAQMTVPVSTFQGGFPLYQPGGNLGSWGSSAPLTTDSSGIAMPMHWQGFYGSSYALPHAQQPPSGLPMQHPMPPPLYPTVSAPGTSNLPPSSEPAPSLPASNMPSLNLPSSNLQVSTPLLPPLNIGSANLYPATPHSDLHPPPASCVSLGVLSSTASTAVPSTASVSASLPLASQLASSGLDINGNTASVSVPKTAPLLPLPYQNTSHSHSTETSKPALLTPGHLLQPRPATLNSSVSSGSAQKDVKVFQEASSGPSPSVRATSQEPILPLPSRPNQKLNGPFNTHHNHITREPEGGRRNGVSSSTTRFTEDFDFIAMNEKFKKDEIWGDLGKANKTKNGCYNRKDDAGDVSDDDTVEKAAYVKDEFFDSLSRCSIGDRQRHERTRYSARTTSNSETFGDFPRHHGGRGGQWPGRGGRSRGSYYGRGYGYLGRGQG